MTIDARAEMYYGSQWHDVTADVDPRSALTVVYGQPDEHGESVPTNIKARLYNTDRKYSPKDPRSELYGKIKINTPFRVRIGDPQPGLSLPGVEGSYAVTPDAAVLDITGDMDVRIEVEPVTWRPGESFTLISKYNQNDAGRSWAFLLTDAGDLQLLWTTDGTVGDRQLRASTVPVPESSGRLAVAVTLDVDDGGDHTVRFFTADSIDATWTQLGDDVTTAGTTSIFGGGADLEIGSANGGGLPISTLLHYEGRVYAAEVRNGIGGTLVADPDFTAQDMSTEAFTDDAGRAWSIEGQATMDDVSLLGSTFIASWIPGWDETTLDAVVDIEAFGIGQRLGQGDDPLRSSLYRDLTTKTNIVAYWPLEDGRDASRFEAGVGQNFFYWAGEVTLADYDDLPASDPLPTIGDGRVFGNIPTYVGDDDQRVMAFFHAPADGVDATAPLIYLHTAGGSTAYWVLSIQTDGALQLRAINTSQATVLNTASLVPGINGKRGIVWLWLSQNGANIDWQVGMLEVGSDVGGAWGGTLSSHTYGRFTHYRSGGFGIDLNGMVVGHPVIMNGDVHTAFWATAKNSLVAWSGETAGNRVLRLAKEEGIPLVVVGDPDETVRLGPQRTTDLMTQFDHAAESDLAVYGEQRSKPYLRFRGHTDRCNQDPALELDMSSGHITNPFEPPLDNSNVRNHITVARDGGSKHVEEQTSGPLNINDPDDDPDGVGRHKGSFTLSLDSDGQLPDQATWRLHLGTVDEHRIAVLELEMEHHPDLQQAVLDMQQGDLIRLANPPAGLPPDDLDLIALGWGHTITNQRWRLTINCAPGSPWNVWVLEGDEYSRLSSVHSELAEDFTAGTDTSLSVASGRFEGFENADQVVEHTDGGDAGWARDNTEVNSGTWSLKAGTIDHSETSDAVITVPAGMTHVSFWYKVSSESNFDFFHFLIDGDEQFTASGEVGWIESDTYSVQPDQTLTFRYSKDGSDSEGGDTAWIDDLSFTVSEIWETDSSLTDVPFDIVVSGVRLRVTAISGGSSPQTFTVEQTPLNGVEKTIDRGTGIDLAHPARPGL